ncbi:hypothetical protein LTR56_022481 [Elasticomyces elasticus]|nr:hypothetical protein LTR22_025731 [Elasticomyces elasticus]KAK3621971.1 hypothetical protein LTR56_022481 [Elasticomyces elasticus]KAK4908343.1 hypothetical protein LTR49_022759 [Elasticomyces elasticus]KAK5748368.1 hypothetical protein LTS12_021587 [Elasticomyces elasticus]
MLKTALFGLAAATQAIALATIQAKGSKLFTSDGNQFYIKGIAYQLTEDDPLAQGDQCKLDATLMKTLGANSIRVYHVDPTADHDACMSAFSDAGIYAWIDVDTFSTYILPDNPEWNETMYDAYASVIDAFHNYDNVAGFYVGNEVLTTGASSIAAPYVKAAARDMKAYRDSKGYRSIPVGYSAADIADLRPNLQNYLACGSNSSESLDFFALNAYEWCGQSDFETSGYTFLQQNASDYNIPIYFSETGCNTPKPRTFDDQAAILGSDMADSWSGAIIYEWIQEANDYGLISYGPSAAATATNAVGGYTRSGTPTPISPDFDNLSNHWKTLTPSGVSMSAYNPSASAPSCPAFTSGNWLVSGNVPLPTLGDAFKASGSSSGSSSGTSSGTVSASPSSSRAGTGGSSASAAPSSTGEAAAATSSAAAMRNGVPVIAQWAVWLGGR